MTAEAVIRQNDPFRRGIDVALIDRGVGPDRATFVRKFGPERREKVQENAAYHAPDMEVYLHLSDDEGRALYEALAKHYGYSPDSPTLLREDYLAERKRVDLFIAKAVR